MEDAAPDGRRFVVAAAVHRAPVSGDEVVLHSETGEYHLWNDTGRFVVAELERGATVGEAAVAVAEHFGIAVETAHADVRAFVDDLVRRNVLVEPGAAAASP